MRRKAAVILMTAVFSAATIFPSLAGSWQYENGGWKYYEDGSPLRNAWKYTRGNWYYFSGNGNMATGLIYVSGDRYYLNSDGSLRMNSFEENGIYYQIDSTGKIVSETDTRKEAQLSGHFDEESEREVLKLTNEARTEAGVGTLEWDESLAGCARTRAVEIGKNFAHTRPDGRSWKTVIDEAGIVTMAWGENIAQGQFTSGEVMEDWLNSEGHRANLLKEGYTKTGAACYVENGVHYWVQLFIQ